MISILLTDCVLPGNIFKNIIIVIIKLFTLNYCTKYIFKYLSHENVTHVIFIHDSNIHFCDY